MLICRDFYRRGWGEQMVSNWQLYQLPYKLYTALFKGYFKTLITNSKACLQHNGPPLVHDQHNRFTEIIKIFKVASYFVILDTVQV
jgi:hypothetical protein